MFFLSRPEPTSSGRHGLRVGTKDYNINTSMETYENISARWGKLL